MYTTYGYYVNKYCFGSPVVSSAADFQKLLLEAESCIDAFTFNRCRELKEVPDDVQRCCCELIEIINKCNQKIEQSGGISSEKNKNYSVTYESTQNLKAQLEADKTSIIKKWLANTGLLYRGC